MKELVCIVCPRGCRISIDQSGGEPVITGNGCKRGETFAKSELTAPMRTICSTVRTVYPEAPVLAVRVSAEIPKARIFDVMREINAVRVDGHPARGDVIIPNVLGLGADVIATSDLLKHIPERKEN